MKREEIQSKALQLLQTNNNIALQLATGVGKSKIAIKMHDYLVGEKAKTSDSPLKVFLVIAEIEHRKNWKKEFSKWEMRNSDITIECYASLKNYTNTEWDLIIFDEAHHIGSDLRLDIISTIKAKNVILLSATLDDTLLCTLANTYGSFKSINVSLKEAIINEILPEPKIYLIPAVLDSTNKNCTIIEEWGKETLRIPYKCNYHDRWEFKKNKHKYPNARLTIICTEQQKYDYLSEQINYWKRMYMRNRLDYTKNKWLHTALKRKVLLGELKTNNVKTLLTKLKNKRYICFCTNIEQCNILSKGNGVHSLNKNSSDIIDSFNKKEINNLFAVGKIQEGQNLEDIEAGIIVQLDGTERPFIQKLGRTLRADDPKQFIFYYKDTRDEEYLNNILEGIGTDYINIVNNITDLKL